VIKCPFSKAVKDLWKYFLLLNVCILVVGCKEAQVGIQATEDQAKSGTVLFRDDFTDVPSGWGTWENDEAVVTYEQDGLRIFVNQPDFDFWSVAGRQFTDTIIEVDAKRLAGPLDNDFGIICRYQNDKNFYMFVNSSDGYYGIVKLKDDQHSLIGLEQLKYNDRIKPNQTDYRLRADCIGHTLKLYMNEFLLLKVQDSDFSSGDVGVLAGAYSTPGVDFLFDNFEVRHP
jgi:hypothetical protein